MNAALTLAFPGSRTLAGWWRQLTPYAPQALWIGHLLLHRVEALADLVHTQDTDPFTRFLLNALALEEGCTGPQATAERHDPLRRMDESLHLGAGLVYRALRELAREGLADVNGGGGWRLTSHGREARVTGAYPRQSQERRGFHFVEPRDRGHSPLPHFISLHGGSTVPAPPPDDWGFDLKALRDCATMPPEWKRRYGFPEEVRAIVGAAEGPPASWQHVVVDRAERLLAVLVPTTAEGAPRLLGFAARQDGWSLSTAEPAFVVRDDWRELFPELTGAAPQADLAAAWQGWAHSRGLPPDESDGCVLEARGERLCVSAPETLLARLRASRTDALKGEAWLLAGEGSVRQALLLDIVSNAPG